MHTFELIKATDSQRTYRLPKKCKRFPRCADVSEILAGTRSKLKPKSEMVDDPADGIDKVTISDAHTHIERLVFPAFSVRNKESGEVFVDHDMVHIAGQLAFLTHGGSSRSVRADKVYLRRIMMLNP